MIDLSTYLIGEREYQTDGVVLLVNQAAATHVSRAAAYEKLCDSILAIHAGKAPTITFNVQWMEKVLKHAHGVSAVSLFIEAPDKPALFVFGKDRFAVLMPIRLEIWADGKFPAMVHSVAANTTEQPPPPADASKTEPDAGQPLSNT